jgi:hypothetical protein
VTFKLIEPKGEIKLVGSPFIKVPKQGITEGSMFVKVPEKDLKGEKIDVKINSIEEQLKSNSTPAYHPYTTFEEFFRNPFIDKSL